MRRVTILQGEHAVCGEPDVSIHTVLGSCIAVCLVDPVRRVGGMNHFLLGEPQSGVNGVDLTRYGVHAMELLINAMMRHGCERSNLRAHLYGGATMIEALGGIGRQNIQFVRQFCRTEDIKVRHEDTGGGLARRVEFHPFEGRSRCLHVGGPVPASLPARAPAIVAGAGELELF